MLKETEERLEQHQAYLENQNEMADWGLREFYNMLLRKESLALRLNLNTPVLDIGQIVDIVHSKPKVTKHVIKCLLTNYLYDNYFIDDDEYMRLHEKIDKLTTANEVFYIPAIAEIILGYYRDKQDIILEKLGKDVEVNGVRESIDDRFVRIVKSL